MKRLEDAEAILEERIAERLRENDAAFLRREIAKKERDRDALTKKIDAMRTKLARLEAERKGTR